MIYAGRTRDLVFEYSGTITAVGSGAEAYLGDCSPDVDPYVPAWARGQLRFEHLGLFDGAIDLEPYLDLDWAGLEVIGAAIAGPSGRVIVGFAGLLMSTQADGASVYTGTFPFQINQTVNVTATLTLPGCRHVFEETGLAPEERDIIDAEEWPNWGGAAEASGDKGRARSDYEVCPAGTTIVLTATMPDPAGGGHVTATVSHQLVNDLIVTDLVRVKCKEETRAVVAGNEDCPGVSLPTADAPANWTVKKAGVAYDVPEWHTGPVPTDAQGGFVDRDELRSRATWSSGPANIHEAEVDHIVGPIRQAKAILTCTAFDLPYPGEVQYEVWDKRRFNLLAGTWDLSSAVVTGNPDAELDIDQRYAIYTGGTSLLSVASVVWNEYNDGIKASLYGPWLASSGEDTGAWRMRLRGKRWEVAQIRHEPSFEIYDGGTITGWAVGPNTAIATAGGALQITATGGPGQVTWGPATQDCEGYRYLEIRIRANVANAPISVRLFHTDTDEDKTFTLFAGAAGTYEVRRLDLCFPNDRPDVVDDQDTRWWNGTEFGKPPKNSGQHWGVNAFNRLVITTPEAVVDVDWIRLARQETTARWCRLPSRRPFLTAWTSPTDTTQGQCSSWSEADGRIKDISYQYRVDPTGPPPAYISFLAIDQALGQMPRGWTVTGLTGLGDGYHLISSPAAWLEGVQYVHGPGGGWIRDTEFEVGSSNRPVHAQSLYDKQAFFAQAGSGMYTGGSYAGRVPIPFATSLRARSWGLVFTSTGPKNAASLSLLRHPSGDVVGSATSDVQGIWQTAGPWARSGQVKLQSGATTTPPQTIWARHRRRWALVPLTLSGGVAIDVREDWRTAVLEAGEPCRLRIFNKRGETEVMLDCPFDGTDVAIAWDAGMKARRLVALVRDGSDLTLRESLNEGETWSMRNLGACTGAVALAIDERTGVRYIYKINAGNVEGLIEDVVASPLALFTVVRAGVDPEALATGITVTERGQREHLLLTKEGGNAILTSGADGLNFS